MYYFSTTYNGSFEDAIEKLTEELKKEGFGVLTDIDIQATLKKKIDVDFKKYRILGACNPGFAYEALTSEDKIGVFLPCNVVVTENGSGKVEIAAVDPVASMQSVNNPALAGIAGPVQDKLKKVIEAM